MTSCVSAIWCRSPALLSQLRGGLEGVLHLVLCFRNAKLCWKHVRSKLFARKKWKRPDEGELKMDRKRVVTPSLGCADH